MKKIFAFSLILFFIFFCFLLYAEAAEREKIIIKDIYFTGANFFSKGQLLDLMETRRRSLLRWWRGILIEEVLEQDLENIKKAYLDKGFLKAKISLKKKFINEDKEVYLIIDIQEGKRHNVSKLKGEKDKRKMNKEELIMKIEEKESAIGLLSGYLEKMQDEKEKLEGVVTDYKKENTSLKAVVKKERGKKEEFKARIEILTKDLHKSEEENNILKGKLNAIGKIFEEKIEVINKAKEIFVTALDEVNLAVRKELDAVELKPIVVSEGELKDMEKDIEVIEFDKDRYIPDREDIVDAVSGEVIVVKKQLNFIIVNIGASDGVEEGMLFNVCRNDEILATARVIEVKKRVSALDIKLHKEDVFVREGDVVKYSALNQGLSFLAGENQIKVA